MSDPFADPFGDTLTSEAIRVTILENLVRSRAASVTPEKTVVFNIPDPVVNKLFRKMVGWPERMTSLGKVKRAVVDEMHAEWRANGYLRGA